MQSFCICRMCMTCYRRIQSTASHAIMLRQALQLTLIMLDDEFSSSHAWFILPDQDLEPAANRNASNRTRNFLVVVR